MASLFAPFLHDLFEILPPANHWTGDPLDLRLGQLPLVAPLGVEKLPDDFNRPAQGILRQIDRRRERPLPDFAIQRRAPDAAHQLSHGFHLHEPIVRKAVIVYFHHLTPLPRFL